MAMIGFMAHANVHTNKPWYSTNAVKKKSAAPGQSSTLCSSSRAWRFNGHVRIFTVYTQYTYGTHIVCLCTIYIYLYYLLGTYLVVKL